MGIGDPARRRRIRRPPARATRCDLGYRARERAEGPAGDCQRAHVGSRKRRAGTRSQRMITGRPSVTGDHSRAYRRRRALLAVAVGTLAATAAVLYALFYVHLPYFIFGPGAAVDLNGVIRVHGHSP